MQVFHSRPLFSTTFPLRSFNFNVTTPALSSGAEHVLHLRLDTRLGRYAEAFQGVALARPITSHPRGHSSSRAHPWPPAKCTTLAYHLAFVKRTALPVGWRIHGRELQATTRRPKALGRRARNLAVPCSLFPTPACQPSHSESHNGSDGHVPCPGEG